MRLFTEKQIKRILGNAGFAFFTVLGAANLSGASELSFKMALIGAFIQGGLAAAQEIKTQCEPDEPKTKKGSSSCILLL
jgi:hypothetical protein